MEKKSALYQYVYDALVSNIQIGNIPTGDKIPSIDQLCEQYRVGRNTVRRALYKLQEDGYVKLMQGVGTIVVYRNENVISPNLSVLHRRKEFILDLCKTVIPILGELIADGIALCPEEEINKLGKLSKDLNPWKHNLEELHRIMLSMMRISLMAFKNPILIDLWESVINYNTIPYIEGLGNKNPHISILNVTQRTVGQMLFYARKNKIDEIKRYMDYMSANYIILMQDYFAYIDNEIDDEKVKDPFELNIGRESRTIYPKIASNILSKIESGIYVDKQFLPLPSALERQYQVAGMTIKHALSLLENAGSIQYVKDKGYQVQVRHTDSLKRCVENHFIRRCMVQCLWVLQIIASTIGSISRNYFHNLQTEMIVQQIEPLNSRETTRFIMHELLMAIESDTLCTIWRKLEELSDWGDVVRYVSVPDENKLIMTRHRENLINSLKHDNISLFSTTLQDIYLHNFILFKEKMLESGVYEIKDIPTPVF